MQRYRLEVGRQHEVSPREIVGAIANEAGLDGRLIGRVEIHEDHSLVELPAGMPKDIFQHLRRVHVRGQKLNITLQGEATQSGSPPHKQGSKRVKKQKPKR